MTIETELLESVLVDDVNTDTDRAAHVQAFERHFEGLYGEGWEDLSMKEAVKVLSLKTLGLNGGHFTQIPQAAENVGFEPHNLVATGAGSVQVLVLVEFDGNAIN